jgi:hypothetical protein
MQSNSQVVQRAQRCTVCDGKFGLVRHYSWRTALCSRKCVDRFKGRQESNRKWLMFAIPVLPDSATRPYL